MANRMMLPLALLLVAASIGLSLFNASRVAGVTAANCREIETLKAAIRTTLVATEHVLGKPRSAGYAYYHTHPAELAQAKRQIAAELRDFSERSCN